MKLTSRDIDVVRHIQHSGGATIEQITKLYFPSYSRASKRLKVLSEAKFIKSYINPTIGKVAYYTTKKPSFHTLAINDILVALKGRYESWNRNHMISDCPKIQVDLVAKMKTGKYMLFEIEIFHRVSEKRIKDIIDSMEFEGIDYELWIITAQHLSDTTKKGKYRGRVSLPDVDKYLSNHG